MCRIAGFIGQHVDINHTKDLVTRMCEAQKHGGPDDFGLYANEKSGVVLGNRRLALLDLSPAGKMPLTYLSRYVITYNGEIYNYRELRSALEKLNHHFQTQTDTEVLVAAFAQWGEAAFSKLNGMFACAIWDMKEEILYLLRDTAGIKPLYYLFQDNQLSFASEIRAFYQMDIPLEQRKDWMVYFMAYGHLPEPVTTLKNIRPLPKGFFLKYSLRKSTITEQSYRHYSYGEISISKQDAIGSIKQSVENAVKRHLLSDAPVAVFLSGGLDSGIITALSSKHKKDINTLSVYFEEKDFSEKKFQDEINKKLGTNAHQLLLKEEDFHHSFENIIQSMDLPSCDGINTWFISEYASENGFKAVLSGLGGDELFGGYPSFNRMGISKLLMAGPNSMKSIFRKSQYKRLNRMAYLNMEGLKGLYLFLRGHFSPYEIAGYLDMDESEVWNILEESPNISALPCNLSHKNGASWIEFNLYMQNQLLRDADVMSMAHGVELRVPFLDAEVISTAFDMPDHIKYSGKYPKQILIDAFGELIPQAVWNRPKMGFSLPFSFWMKNNKMMAEWSRSSVGALKKYHHKFIEDKIHWSQMMTLTIMSRRYSKGYA